MTKECQSSNDEWVNGGGRKSAPIRRSMAVGLQSWGQVGWWFNRVKSVIAGVFEEDDNVGCARYRCAMARIGSDREARSETREGACSPRERVGCELLGGCFWGGFMTVLK